MAASFKQQCPSCEAMVLVKDPKQIGKKVDCPRCKYRFVVEAPAEENAAAEAPVESGETEIKDEDKSKPKASQAITAKKPGPAAAPTIRKKAGPRKAEDGADEPKAKKKKQQSSGSMVLILGIGMSICAVVLLGIGGYFIFLAPKEDPRAGRTTMLRTTRPVLETEPEKKGGLVLIEMTNLLPNDTEGILSFNFKDLVRGAVGRAAFETPGAFRHEFVEQRFGLKAKEVDRVLVGQNFGKDLVFAVIRTSNPIDLPGLTKALDLKPGPDSPYRGQEYYVAKPSEWLDQLGRLLTDFYPQLKLAPALRLRSPAFRVVDSQTLVVADLEAMKSFLDTKGQPKAMAEPAPLPKSTAARRNQAASKTYLTVKPELKALIEQMENKKPSLVCFAWEVEPVRKRMLAAADLLKPTGLADDKLVAMLGDLQVVGASLQMRDNTILTFGLGGKDPGFAKATTQQLRARGEAIGQLGLFSPSQVLVEFDGKPLVPPPAGQPPLPKGAKVPVPDLKLSVRTAPADKVLVVNLEFQFNAMAAGKAIQDFLQPQMIVLHGLTEMVGASPRIQELAAAITALTKKDGNLPRGTFNRPLDAKRLGRPYPPAERVGWMAELLPYLGYDDVYRRIQFKQSWKSDQNAQPGLVLVPAFLDAQSPPSTWWVHPPYVGGQMYGATHYVGIAGVGLDAAEYAAEDKSVAGKIGPLGYDRQIGLGDIKDGAANTILMLQVPPNFKRPWIAGGGATLVGVPETDSIRPFVGTFGKNRGTYAIMADGSVRFISEKISDEAFKAMCTVNGSEKVDVDKEAPKPPGTELKVKP